MSYQSCSGEEICVLTPPSISRMSKVLVAVKTNGPVPQGKPLAIQFNSCRLSNDVCLCFHNTL